MGTAIVEADRTALHPSGEPDSHQYLTFMLGGETFAIGILSVREIIEYGHLTTVPMMPPHIRGVINLRGAVVPVIDLAARFGRERAQLSKRTCIVIVEVNRDGATHELGMVVDQVNEVVDIAPEQIAETPSFGAQLRTDFLRGMGRVSDRFVMILRIDRVLSSDELVQLEQAAAMGAPGA